MQNNKPVIVIDNQPVQLCSYPVYEMALAVARFYLLPVMIMITVRVIKLPTSKGNHYAIDEKLLLWLEHYQKFSTKDMR